MLSDVAPSLSTMLRAACWAISSVTPVCTQVVNPCSVARVSYFPGASPDTVKYPLVSVTTFRVRPVPRLLTTRSTPGSTPPVSSLMVPESVAEVICARARDALVARRTTARITLNLMTASLSSDRAEAHDSDLFWGNQGSKSAAVKERSEGLG